MKMERSLRVFVGLGIMAATVGAVGSIGGWSRPEPPVEHAAPAKAAPKAEPKPEVKPEPARPGAPRQDPKAPPRAESVQIEPVWNQTPRAASPASKPPTLRTEPSSAPASTQRKASDVDSGHAGSASLPAFEGTLTPDEAIAALREGNERWIGEAFQAPNSSESRRRSLAAQGQTPFATILTCADSRVPVERVFDRGVGDLFVLRVAGNVAGAHEAGTIEYGVEHLHVPLLVVMGHTKCGAVAAAASGSAGEGNMASLVGAITPAVERARALNPSLNDAELTAAAVRENVWQSVFDLVKSSPPCRQRVRDGELRIIGAVYDIASGEVQWLGEHPWQREIIAAIDANDGGRRAGVASDGSH